MKIFEEKDRVRIILAEGDLLEVSTSTHDPINIKCENSEIKIEEVHLKTILDKKEEEEAIQAMRDYIKQKDKNK